MEAEIGWDEAPPFLGQFGSKINPGVLQCGGRICDLPGKSRLTKTVNEISKFRLVRQRPQQRYAGINLTADLCARKAGFGSRRLLRRPGGPAQWGDPPRKGGCPTP